MFQCRRPVTKQRQSTLLPSISKKTACSVGKCVLWDQILAIHQDGKSPFCAELQTRAKGKKDSRMSCYRYVILYQWKIKFKLNFIWTSKSRFHKINEKFMWFMETMWKFVKKFQDGRHNSHWNLYLKMVKMNVIFVNKTASLWDKPKQVWRSG